MRKFIYMIILLLPTLAYADTETVTEKWGGYVMEWSNGSQLIIRYATFAEDGMMKVCVATTSRRSIPYNLVKEALRRGYIEFSDETRIIRDLRFAKIYSSRYANGQLVGEEAPCKTTKVAVQNMGSRIVFPSGRYSYSK